MAIQLTTPVNPGDLDTGASYTHVAVTEFTDERESKNLIVKWRLGYLENGVFQPGLLPVVPTAFTATEYDAIKAVPCASLDELPAEALVRALEGQAITSGLFVGEVAAAAVDVSVENRESRTVRVPGAPGLGDIVGTRGGRTRPDRPPVEPEGGRL